jgi:branched-chain amino acid transport system permease protein
MTFGAWAELVASGLITGGVYALVALGLNLQYGLMRILNIAHGEFLMLGAYLAWMAQTGFGISPLVMLPVAFVLLMALGLVIHRLTFRRLARTSPDLDVFEARGLMVAFGLMFLVQNLPSSCGEASCAATTGWPSRWRSAVHASPPTSCCYSASPSRSARR